MDIIRAVILVVGGFLILWKCAEVLVGGAVGLAERLGVSPLVIGLTIVAMGTSAPEVAASIAAALRGAGDVAVGNVYGSNIANLALIGGISALIRPIKVKKQTLLREMPVMLAAALVLWPLLHNLFLSRPKGIGLLGLFAVLILLTIYGARREAKNRLSLLAGIGGEIGKEVKVVSRPTPICLLLIAIGLVGLAAGAEMSVRGAVSIGERIGLSKAVIGLTIIAVGTSLPELATCIAAAIKGHHDISIGNLVGSNIFNTLLVTGVAGTVRPFEVTKRLVGSDYWIMIGVSAAFIVITLAGRATIGRIGGILLLCCYAAYMLYLFV
ncbi:MAG TPA: calcium/sodium antiporter [Sedimentisphaerales bacterium]|nr:calcium/sodium antiporter [Sedimentisphaerales bacterium]